jgi:hypothetical protein
MPQFDFFIWFSLSLGTVLTFQLLYYFILYYILAPFSNLQKTLIKLYTLKQTQKASLQTSLFEQLTKIYFQKIKLKKDLQEVTSEKTSKEKNESSNLKPKAVVLKKKINLIILKKNTKKNNLKKKDIILKTLEKKLNITGTPLKFIISKKKVQKKNLNKNLNKKSSPKKAKKS